MAMDILVVEDADVVREVISALLEDTGFAVVVAQSAEEALEKLEAGGPPRALVTDVDLGSGMNGVALAEVVTGLCPNIGIVFITGRPWVARGHPLTARERLITKPFGGVQFINAVQEVLAAA